MSFWSHPLHIVLGLVVWALWFVAMYGLLSVGCVAAPPPAQAGTITWINAVLLGLTLLTSAALIWASWRCRQQRAAMAEASSHRRFTVSVASILYGFAAAATALIGLTVVVYPPCV